MYGLLSCLFGLAFTLMSACCTFARIAVQVGGAHQFDVSDGASVLQFVGVVCAAAHGVWRGQGPVDGGVADGA